MIGKFCIAVLVITCVTVTGLYYGDGFSAQVHAMQDDITGQIPQDDLQTDINSHNTDALVSQGVAVIGSDLVNHDGYTGKGVKIAVIDTGFNIYNPEIADNISGYRSFVYPDLNIAGDDHRHGTGVAEIIVDVAPDVELYLYNINNVIGFLNLADHILERGDIDAVSMSLGFLNTIGPTDGTNVISQKVDQLRDNGILWVNAAGNYANNYWHGTFTDSNGDSLHNFQPDSQVLSIDVDVTNPLVLILSWDDWNYSSQDYELCLIGEFLGELRTITCSTNTQNGSFPPVEIIQYVSPYAQTVYAVILKHDADRDVNFQLLSLNHGLKEFAVSRSSIIIPADADGSFSIGARHWNDGELQSYSSHGPTLDGRVKPDITAPTGVFTTAYCGFSCNSFHGTSASAPHVAGAAALVMEKYPDITPEMVQSILEATVNDRHPKSNEDGTGYLNVSMLSGTDILALDNANSECDPCFFPNSLNVYNGDMVVWVNSGNDDIKIGGSMGDVEFESNDLARGEKHSEIFEISGTVEYSDLLHTWALGKITVNEIPAPEDVPPELLTAAVTSSNQITITFSETIHATPSSITDLVLLPGGNRTVTSIDGSGTDTIILEFDGEPVLTNSTATMNIAVVDDTGDMFTSKSTTAIEPVLNAHTGQCQTELGGCFTPSVATVSVGGMVTFTNTDSVAHTFTAGTVYGGSAREFDSGLLVAGSIYEYVTETIGEIPYFCEVHPWMSGLILVQDNVRAFDGQLPVLDVVSIDSSNTQNDPIIVGDVITLAFSPSEEITDVAVTINENESLASTVFGNTYSSTRIIESSDPTGPVTFTIDFYDMSGNLGTQVTTTTDGSVAGDNPQTSVTGRIFSDANSNGIMDEGEVGISGHEITAIDITTSHQSVVTTESDGVYTFNHVRPYPASTLIQTGMFPRGHTLDVGVPWFTYVQPQQGSTATFDVGFYPVPPKDLVTLEVIVYHDANQNGLIDVGESTIEGVKGLYVHTYSIGDVAFIVPDADGRATVDDLVPEDFALLAMESKLASEYGYAWVTTNYERDDGVTDFDSTVSVVENPAPGSTHTMLVGMMPIQ